MIVRKKPPHAPAHGPCHGCVSPAHGKDFMVSKPDERDPDGRTDRLSALPSVADRYRDHASFPVASGRDARPGERNSDFKTRTTEKERAISQARFLRFPFVEAISGRGVKIVGQPLRLLCDCRRRSPERLRFRSKRDYCLDAFGTINGTKASARISPCGARSGSSQRDTVTFIRYFPGFTPSSGTRTVAVSRGGMSAEQIPSATTRFAPATIW